MESASIFLSAGDPSGDTASARLVSALKERRPQLNFFGLGGHKLRELGQHQLAEPDDLAVLGFWEVARRYLFFRRLFSSCIRQIKASRPSVVVLVDYPGFNLRLARKIKPLGIPVVYYISPQVWAWGGKRLDDIRNLVDTMLLILPFERDFYRSSAVSHEFVGHYLLEDIPDEFISSTVPDRAALTLGLLPGSRPQEIKKMLPPMLEAASAFNKKFSGRTVVAGVSNKFDYRPYLEKYSDDNIEIVIDRSREVIYGSTLVLTASGTATLETAIIGRPMVVVYKTGWITYHIARRLVRLDRIALANLVLGETVVPELIQRQASPDNMLSALENYVDDEKYRVGVIDKLNRVPGLLGGKGASARAAEVIAGYLP
ncbi:MAG: lipid-A-disaccharide synthase [Candidatus Zixiibacteriota bacterium]|nr:MAG: lipid-A-disaccharide synthase [candidate division Zixibacteria bacterium]